MSTRRARVLALAACFIVFAGLVTAVSAGLGNSPADAISQAEEVEQIRVAPLPTDGWMLSDTREYLWAEEDAARSLSPTLAEAPGYIWD